MQQSEMHENITVMCKIPTTNYGWISCKVHNRTQMFTMLFLFFLGDAEKVWQENPDVRP